MDDRIEQLEAKLRDAEIEKAVLNRNIHLLQNQLDISGHKAGGPDVQARTDSVSETMVLSLSEEVLVMSDVLLLSI